MALLSCRMESKKPPNQPESVATSAAPMMLARICSRSQSRIPARAMSAVALRRLLLSSIGRRRRVRINVIRRGTLCLPATLTQAPGSLHSCLIPGLGVYPTQLSFLTGIGIRRCRAQSTLTKPVPKFLIFDVRAPSRVHAPCPVNRSVDYLAPDPLSAVRRGGVNTVSASFPV